MTLLSALETNSSPNIFYFFISSAESVTEMNNLGAKMTDVPLL